MYGFRLRYITSVRVHNLLQVSCIFIFFSSSSVVSLAAAVRTGTSSFSPPRAETDLKQVLQRSRALDDRALGAKNCSMSIDNCYGGVASSLLLNVASPFWFHQHQLLSLVTTDSLISLIFTLANLSAISDLCSIKANIHKFILLSTDQFHYLLPHYYKYSQYLNHPVVRWELLLCMNLPLYNLFTSVTLLTRNRYNVHIQVEDFSAIMLSGRKRYLNRGSEGMMLKLRTPRSLCFFCDVESLTIVT